MRPFTEAEMIPQFEVAGMCSTKKMYLKISQNSQENTCARVSFLVILVFFKYNYHNLILNYLCTQIS